MLSPTFGLPPDSPLLPKLHQQDGARFYRCALQVNPFDYTTQTGQRQHGFPDEPSYNQAMVAALVAADIQVIALMDHWKASTGAGLMAAAQASGIRVLPGFEASSREGVHLLCLFEETASLTTLDYYASTLRGGVPGPVTDTRDSETHTLENIVDKVKEWEGICIAAHMTDKSGLLNQQAGDTRQRHWKYEPLLAGCIKRDWSELQEKEPGLFNIINNRDDSHLRKQPMTLLNARDVSDPAQIQAEGACGTWTLIKMSEVTIEGLRQAFLDPRSRVRLASQAPFEQHIEVVAAMWQGGLLDGVTLGFNENLNVLVGGRGTGKSSIIETLRYALGTTPLGEEAQRASDGIVKNALKSGGKISVVIRQPQPAASYLVERSYPNPPLVRDETGNVLNAQPTDVLRLLPEIYGQHEIAELARDDKKLTQLLRRYVPVQSASRDQKIALRRELTASQQKLLAVAHELEEADEALAKLPGLRETLRRYESVGLEEKLRAQTQWQREGALFAQVEAELSPADSILNALRDAQPLNQDFVGESRLRDLPNAELLAALRGTLTTVDDTLQQLTTTLQAALAQARQQVANVHSQWKPLRTAADEVFQAQLRELETQKIDGADFLQLRRQIDNLQPLEKRKNELLLLQEATEQRRRNLLAEWRSVLERDQRELQKTANRLNGQLNGRVRVSTTYQGQREELLKILDEALAREAGAHRKPIVDAVRNSPTLSLEILAELCRGNAAQLRQQIKGLTLAQAERLARIGAKACFAIEELDLPPTTQMELNVAPVKEQPKWRPLPALSVGQRATAVLRLLLVPYSVAPLLIDQPEDDLDNRFIAEDIVPRIKEEKMRRQFIFATHNANLPVLGDAELIIGLKYHADKTTVEASGALDTPAVHQLVEEVLEGGRAAFEYRRIKYNY